MFFFFGSLPAAKPYRDNISNRGAEKSIACAGLVVCFG